MVGVVFSSWFQTLNPFFALHTVFHAVLGNAVYHLMDHMQSGCLNDI